MIVFKVLNQHQDEEIEHHKDANEDEKYKVNLC